MAERLKVYEIDDFEGNKGQGSFYINTLAEHLEKHPFVTKPHRHGFYIIVYFTSGTGTHTIDFVKYSVSPGSIFFLKPGQVHNWTLSADTEGRILFFKKEFIEDYFIKKVTSYLLFHAKNQLLKIDDPVLENQVSIELETIAREYLSSVRDFDLIRNYLDIVLIKLGRMINQKDIQIPDSGTWAIQKLESLIEHHFPEHQPPAFYAEHLNFSVKYLSDVCKKYLNKTTSQLIHERVVLEAKRLLTHDNLSIKEVGSQLNFEDPAYFTRYFKKMTGESPIHFRTQVKTV